MSRIELSYGIFFHFHSVEGYILMMGSVVKRAAQMLLILRLIHIVEGMYKNKSCDFFPHGNIILTNKV